MNALCPEVQEGTAGGGVDFGSELVVVVHSEFLRCAGDIEVLEASKCGDCVHLAFQGLMHSFQPCPRECFDPPQDMVGLVVLPAQDDVFCFDELDPCG